MSSRETSASICAIVVNYNGLEFLEDCLNSLAAQTLAPKRVIVVDNASTDGSADIAQQHDLGVELIRNKDNLGFAAANNQAIAEASDCEWLALLNPDAIADSKWLENLVSASQQFPEYCSFASLQRVADSPNVCDGTGDCYHAFGYGWRIGHNLPIQSDLPDSEEVFASCAAACLLNREAVEKAGGFDVDYFCYGEDLDLGFRLRLAGGKALFVKAAEVLHHQSAITGLASQFSIYHGQRNLIWTFIKNMPTPLLVFGLLPHFLLNILAITAHSIRGQYNPVLRAKRDALQGLTPILEKRRAIQSNPNRISSSELAKSMEFSIGKLMKRFASA